MKLRINENQEAIIAALIAVGTSSLDSLAASLDLSKRSVASIVSSMVKNKLAVRTDTAGVVAVEATETIQAVEGVDATSTVEMTASGLAVNKRMLELREISGEDTRTIEFEANEDGIVTSFDADQAIALAAAKVKRETPEASTETVPAE